MYKDCKMKLEVIAENNILNTSEHSQSALENCCKTYPKIYQCDVKLVNVCLEDS